MKYTLEFMMSEIRTKYPQLTPEHLDDLSALLEKCFENYGENFFNQTLTFQNAMRITGLKYIAIKEPLMDIVKENLHGDIPTLKWALENQEIVFKKLDELHAIRDRFPEYPVTDLSEAEERKLTIEIVDFDAKGTIKFSLMPQTPIGSMIIANPKIIYYLMP